MTEKAKYLDRILSRRNFNKFDTSLLSNDGGKYSPSIRRLVCNLDIYLLEFLTNTNVHS